MKMISTSKTIIAMIAIQISTAAIAGDDLQDARRQLNETLDKVRAQADKSCGEIDSVRTNAANSLERANKAMQHCNEVGDRVCKEVDEILAPKLSLKEVDRLQAKCDEDKAFYLRALDAAEKAGRDNSVTCTATDLNGVTTVRCR